MASILAASQHVRRATGLCASTSGSRFVGVLASSVRRGIICSERRVAGAADSKDAGMASNGQQGGRGGSGKQRQGGEKVQLDESDALFQPWLTERDPKGHKSGYVAIVGKPNAGKVCVEREVAGDTKSSASEWVSAYFNTAAIFHYYDSYEDEDQHDLAPRHSPRPRVTPNTFATVTYAEHAHELLARSKALHRHQ